MRVFSNKATDGKLKNFIWPEPVNNQSNQIINFTLGQNNFEPEIKLNFNLHISHINYAVTANFMTEKKKMLSAPVFGIDNYRYHAKTESNSVYLPILSA